MTKGQETAAVAVVWLAYWLGLGYLTIYALVRVTLEEPHTLAPLAGAVIAAAAYVGFGNLLWSAAMRFYRRIFQARVLSQ